MRRFLLDMETSDPDDFLTLLLLLAHPEVDLVAVTVTPGTREQLGLVRWALGQVEGASARVHPRGLAPEKESIERTDVVVGAFSPEHDKRCVSHWHYNAYNLSPTDAEPDALGHVVMARHFTEDSTLVTGAALKNLGKLLKAEGPSRALGRLVVQGGFAGEGVVPAERQLPKFRGLVTAPSFNLNGDPPSVLHTLEQRARFRDLRFVSKNVCHGVIYDQAVHTRVTAALAQMAPGSRRHRCWSLIVSGMAYYLNKNPGGKAFHDPLAACCAIDETIASWAEVEIYRERGEWGSRLAVGSGVRIIVDIDRGRFIETMLGPL